MVARTLAGGVAAALAVAGCGGGEATTPRGATTTARAGTPAGVLVSLGRSGGLTGTTVGVEVERSGVVRPVPRGRTLRLGPAELAALEVEVRAAPVRAGGERVVTSTTPMPDAFLYVVATDAGGLAFAEGEEPPARALPLVRRLLGLLRRTGAG